MNTADLPDTKNHGDEPANVYLIGFMACGKTRIGKLIARKLARPFLDTDEMIVRKTGMPIPEIFEKWGESRFREIEKEIVSQVAGLRGRIVALGGGAVLDPGNWELLDLSGTIICLSYPPEIIEERAARSRQRPLLNQESGRERKERIRSLLESRESVYRKADLLLHLNQEVDARRVAAAIIGFLGKPE
ncbi:shikimate kinase [bacterium]|nr:shikimate kinase [bacterium]